MQVDSALNVVLAYLEMVIFVPDSAIIRFRVPPPLPAQIDSVYM